MFRFVLVILLLVPLPLHAALINTFYLDSPSELDYLFESGQIDYDQFELLDEFYSTPVEPDSGDSNLTDNLGIEADSLEAIKPKLPAAQEKKPKAQTASKFNIKSGYKAYNNFSTYLPKRQVISLSGGFPRGLRFNVEAEKLLDSENYHFRKRNLSLVWKKARLELGSFVPDWGMGITLGYHNDFLLKSRTADFRSFWFPTLGRYNGVRFGYDGRVAPLLMASYDRSPSARARLLAFGCNYKADDFKLGVLASYQQIESFANDQAFHQWVMGSYLDWSNGMYGIKGELSEIDLSHFAWEVKGERQAGSIKSSLAVWNYERGYHNPYGAGQANSDYLTIEIEGTDLNYRSRQNGEWGILAQTEAKVTDRQCFILSANLWRDGGSEDKIRAKISDRLVLGEHLEGMITYLWGDDNLNADYGDRQHLRLDLAYSDKEAKQLRLSCEAKRVYGLTGRQDYLRAEIKSRIQISKELSSTIRISRIDSDLTDGVAGFWLIHFGEDLNLRKQTCLRLTLDSREGAEYNLLNSVRFNMQLLITVD